MKIKLTSRAKGSIVLSSLLITGLIAARWIWPLICLPYANPWQVSGPLTSIGYNPNNDILRFGVWIGLPLLFLFLFWTITGKNLSFWHWQTCTQETSHARRKIFVPALMIMALVASLNIPTDHACGKLVDTFHEGESLGPAVSLLHGKAPYRDIIFLHGPYQDPLRSMLAFRLFGKSIGAVRTLESIHQMIAMLLLAILCLALFPGRPTHALVLLMGLIGLQISHKLWGVEFIRLKSRDMTTFAFLTICALLQHKGKNTRITAACAFVFGAVPVAAFAYSIDCGFFLTAAMVMLWPLVWFGLAKNHNRLIFILISFLSALLGAMLVGWSIRWQWKPFTTFVLGTMPRYKELMDGFVFPIHKWPFLMVSIVLAAVVYLVAVNLLCIWSSTKGGPAVKLETISRNRLV